VTESSTSPLVGCSRSKAAYSLSSDDDDDVKEVVVVVLDISTVLNWKKDPQVLQPLFPSLTPSSSSSSSSSTAFQELSTPISHLKLVPLQ
jgi:hypothetical protein